MLKKSLGILIALLPLVAWGATWDKAGHFGDSDYYYTVSTYGANPHQFKAWLKNSSPSKVLAKSIDMKSVAFMSAEMLIDCDKHQYAPTGAFFYDKNQVPVDNLREKTPSYQDPPPETVAFAIVQQVCSGIH